jgi:hypothetical protein
LYSCLPYSALEVPKKTRRTRRDLTPDEFDFLLSFVDHRQQRLLALASTLGSRINELFLLDRGWVELDVRRIVIALEVTKEKREKILDLTDEETALLREQLVDVDTRLGARTTYVFPKPHGSRWRYGHFHEDVWAPAKRRAIAEWRCKEGYVCRLLSRMLRCTRFAGPALAGCVQVSCPWRSSRSGSATTTVGRHFFLTIATFGPGEARSALDDLGSGVRARLRDLAASAEAGDEVG